MTNKRKDLVPVTIPVGVIFSSLLNFLFLSSCLDNPVNPVKGLNLLDTMSQLHFYSTTKIETITRFAKIYIGSQSNQ